MSPGANIVGRAAGLTFLNSIIWSPLLEMQFLVSNCFRQNISNPVIYIAHPVHLPQVCWY